jgi:protein-tyrosine phosphatase
VPEPFFVDVHSHVVPSGDDGAGTVEEGRALCVSAAAHGTGLLFATPHVWPELPLTPERERAVREAHAEVAARAGLELRLGFELTPTRALLRQDPRRFLLEGTEAVLVEVPFVGSAGDLLLVAAHIEAAGLQPVIAHPERTEPVLSRPGLAGELAGRGWLLQINASSLLGRHGPAPEALGWRLVEDGMAALVASDGHRRARPAHLDEAYAAAVGRVGEAAARPLFDGSALGLARVSEPAASRAATRGA